MKLKSISLLSTDEQSLDNANNIFVAVSGGVDSIVLLDLLLNYNSGILLNKLHVLHCNHSINKDADIWQQQVETFCAEYKIKISIEQFEFTSQQISSSFEAHARKKRYNFFSTKLNSLKDILLTAHHADDQAETIIHHLCRGTGLKGMRSAAHTSRLGKGSLLRPLLNITKAQILEYAKQNKLTWHEDSSNKQIIYNRNYIRQNVIPQLKLRWPRCVENIAQSITTIQQEYTIIQEVASTDFNKCYLDDKCALNLAELLKLSSARQMQVLRFMLESRQTPLPSRKNLTICLNKLNKNQFVNFNWLNYTFRSYKGALYFFAEANLNNALPQRWDLKGKLIINKNIKICPEQLLAKGLSSNFVGKKISIKYREPGARIIFKNNNTSFSKPLKKCLQEWCVPPWLRNYIPMLYFQDKLIAVGEYWVSPHVSA